MSKVKNTQKDKDLHKCPRCGKMTSFRDNPYRPFCSYRCKMIDLGAWIKEEYKIPDPIYDPDIYSNTDDDFTDK